MIEPNKATRDGGFSDRAMTAMYSDPLPDFLVYDVHRIRIGDMAQTDPAVHPGIDMCRGGSNWSAPDTKPEAQ